MSFISGNNVFKTAAFVAGLGYLWFSFLSPEAANASVKANFCLVAGLVALIAYFYGNSKNNEEFNERDSIYRTIDDRSAEQSRENDRIWNAINDLQEKSDCGSSCPTKKVR